MLFRWDAPLFFANAEFFHDRVLAAIASSPTPVRWLVVAAEPVTSIDVTSADALCELDDTLRAAGVQMCFAEMKDPVKDKLKRFGVMARFGERPSSPPSKKPSLRFSQPCTRPANGARSRGPFQARASGAGGRRSVDVADPPLEQTVRDGQHDGADE